jgi:hypothetical protein
VSKATHYLRARPTALRAYVAAIVVAAVVAITVAAVLSPFTLFSDAPTTALVLLLVIQGHLLRIRVTNRQHQHDLNFVEASLAVLFIAHSTIDVAVVAAVAAATSMVAQRVRDRRKAAFNIGMWTLVALIGVVVYGVVRDAAPGRGGVLLAIVAATSTAVVANQFAFTVAITLAEGRSSRPQRLGQDDSVLAGRILSAAVAVTFGVLLAGAALWSRWTIICGFATLTLLYWAS